MPRGSKRSTSWKPGQSGNPVGSSREQCELRRRRRNTEKAFVDVVPIQLEITTAAAAELCRRGLVAPGHERDDTADDRAAINDRGPEPPAAWVRHQFVAVRQRICLIRVSSSIGSTIGAGLPSGIARSLVSLKSASIAKRVALRDGPACRGPSPRSRWRASATRPTFTSAPPRSPERTR
jgi:hypothetical protein